MRHSIRLGLALAFVSVTAAGCKKKDAPKPAPAPVAAPAAPVAPAAREPDPAGAEAMRTLGGRLSYEAGHRPSGTVRVEDVMTAFGAAGVTLIQVKQYIALTAAASYCAGGRTAEGLAIAVCEYDSPAAAAAGRDHVLKTFANVAGRQITIRGATSLTTTAPDGADVAVLRAKAEQAFSTL